MARGMSALNACALFAFAIASGTAFVMTLKLASLQTAVGLAGSPPHLFAHPLFQPFVKFFGASLWFVAFMAYSCFRRGIAKHERDLLAARNARDGENIGIDTPGFPSLEPGARSRGTAAAAASGIIGDADAFSDYSAWIFFLPATLDWFASSMAYVGLEMTDVSTFQVLRDVSMLCFVALFGAVFTKRSLSTVQLLAFAILICGAILVYSASVDHTAPGNPQHVTNPTLGNALVIISQFFVAGHLFVEQSIVRKYAISPLAVVGWQGVFGLGIMSAMQLVYYFLPGRAVGRRLENAPDAFMQISHSPTLMACFFGGAIALAVFYACGVGITANFSATTRAVVDINRAWLIWLFSIAIGWDAFDLRKLGAVFVLIIGFAVYSNACRCLVTATPLCAYCCCCCPTASVREGGRDSDQEDDESEDGGGSSGDEGAGSESEGEGVGDQASGVAGRHAGDRRADASADDARADGQPRMRTHSAHNQQSQHHQQYHQQQQQQYQYQPPQYRDVSFSFPSRDDERSHSRSPAQPAITAAHADDFARQFFSSSSSSSSSFSDSSSSSSSFSDSSSFASSSAPAADFHSHPFPASGGSATGRTVHFERAAPSSLLASGFSSPLGRAPAVSFHPPASAAAAATASASVHITAHSPSDAHTHTVLVGADEAGAVVNASAKKTL